MNTITEASIMQYIEYLYARRRAPSTVQKYVHSIRLFAAWLGDRSFTREAFAQWARQLDVSPRTANGAISAVNGLAAFLRHGEVRLELNRVETPYYRAEGKELKRAEYERLLTAARQTGKERLYLTVMTIAALGIRVSELKYITAAAVEQGEARITNKGKTRSLVIPDKLRARLNAYIHKRGIQGGPIFLTRSGKPLSRGQVWEELKKLARAAGVALAKVFPHNLRHLFAVLHYQVHKDIFTLSRILGHSSVKTTQIYLITSSKVFGRGIEILGLIQ